MAGLIAMTDSLIIMFSPTTELSHPQQHQQQHHEIDTELLYTL